MLNPSTNLGLPLPSGVSKVDWPVWQGLVRTPDIYGYHSPDRMAVNSQARTQWLSRCGQRSCVALLRRSRGAPRNNQVASTKRPCSYSRQTRKDAVIWSCFLLHLMQHCYAHESNEDALVWMHVVRPKRAQSCTTMSCDTVQNKEKHKPRSWEAAAFPSSQWPILPVKAALLSTTDQART